MGKHRHDRLLQLVAANRDPRRGGGNYRQAVRALLSSGQLPIRPGTVTHVEVLHDDWCAFWQGGVCDCEPEIRLHELQAMASGGVAAPDSRQ